MKTDRKPDAPKNQNSGWPLVFVAIIGSLALTSCDSKGIKGSAKSVVAESTIGFGAYYMKFEKVAEFNAADAVSGGVQQAFGVTIPSEFIAQNCPSSFRGTFIFARLLSYGEAYGSSVVTSNYLLLRENSVPECKHFIIRRGRTLGWFSKPADENRIYYYADTGGSDAPDGIRGQAIVIEIINWEGDWTVID
jgi:hypothetical protein